MKVMRSITAAILGAIAGTVLAYEEKLNSILLEKAVPLEQYEKDVIASGGKPFRRDLLDEMERDLGNVYYNDDATSNVTAYDGDDDYFLNQQSLSFNGYALKYGTCQKIQRFSVNAIQRGEYSSMVTDNIVILRLCPQKSCNANSRYGCNTGYGEYAMDVTEYMTILLKYEEDKKQRMCSLCNSCFAPDDDDNQNNNGTSYYYAQAYQNGYGNRDLASNNMCNKYYNKCANMADDCSGNSASYLDYLNYVGCVEINDYFINPSCDPDNGQIIMSVFYDKYCGQDAGDMVGIENFLGEEFDQDVFETIQKDVECLSCSSTNYAPFYDAHNLFCNNIYENSGQCDSSLGDKLTTYYGNNTDYVDDENTCAYIDSVRVGTYDAYGEIYVKGSQYSNADGVVTGTQQAQLIVLFLIVIALAVYSCVLHHQMTNMLLIALSRGLISPSKRTNGRTHIRSRYVYNSDSCSTDGGSSTDYSYV